MADLVAGIFGKSEAVECRYLRRHTLQRLNHSLGLIRSVQDETACCHNIRRRAGYDRPSGTRHVSRERLRCIFLGLLGYEERGSSILPTCAPWGVLVGDGAR